MISEQQLQQWASAPAATKYKHTHEEIRKALSSYLSEFAKNNHGYEIKAENYDVYLTITIHRQIKIFFFFI